MKGRDETSGDSDMEDNPGMYSSLNKMRKKHTESQLGRIKERKLKKKRRVQKLNGEYVTISYRDYLLAKAYGGEPKATIHSGNKSSSSRASSRHGGSRF